MPRRLRLSLGLLSALWMPINAIAQEITFLTHNIAEQTTMDASGELRGVKGKGLRGYLVELVRELMIRTNYHPRVFVEVPFARGLKMVQTEPSYALFNISRTAEREGTVKWVGPTYESATYFYKRAGSDIEIASIEDAKRVSAIGVQNKAGNDTELTALGFTNLVRAKTQGHILKMMTLGRVDLVPIGENVVETLTQQMDIDPELIEKTPVKLWPTIGYIAFSKTTPDATVAKWQTALDELRNSSRHEELIQEYYGR
ncbi:MAG: substrate-binding periplasmic protein [Gammaproteobacteria bacterium]